MDNQDWVYSRQEDRADPQAGGRGGQGVAPEPSLRDLGEFWASRNFSVWTVRGPPMWAAVCPGRPAQPKWPGGDTLVSEVCSPSFPSSLHSLPNQLYMQPIQGPVGHHRLELGLLPTPC